jgi:hypothetical protein
MPAKGADASWAVAGVVAGFDGSADLMAAMAFRKMSVMASCSARAAAEVKEKTWFSGAAAPAGETTTFKATLGFPAGVCWRSGMISHGSQVVERDGLTCNVLDGNGQ